MESKQTAVEWLQKQFNKERFIEKTDFEIALKMETEQILDSYYSGQGKILKLTKSVTVSNMMENADKYYIETYGKIDRS